jgi:hypothetical protein
MWYRSLKGRVRGELVREDANKEFESRPKGHFAYDEVSNEWDICSLFDVDQYDKDHDDATYDDSPLDSSDSHIDNTVVAVPRPEITKPMILPPHHNEIGRSIVHHGDIEEDILFASSLEDVLSSRYGLTYRTQLEIQSASDFTTIEDARIVELSVVRKYLMEMNLPLSLKRNDFAVRYFVSCLVHRIALPSIIWDLHPDRAQELVESNVYFDITFVKDGSCIGYTMIPRIAKYARTWNLIIESATSVIQCIREQWGPSLEDVIICIFDRGIRFKVISAVVHHPIPRPKTVFESNYRAFGWQPDKYEYMDYEVRRNRLLRMPHVRVAVAQGGILWRLCKQELAAVIPSGPSTDVHFFADASSCKYLFDTLSEEEIDVLCGVYHVDTGVYLMLL